MQKIAFVLGNGTSRNPVDVSDLMSSGPVYACNAIYRTTAVDYVVAVDTKMIAEIVKSGYQESNQVWTNYKKGFEQYSGLNFIKPKTGWSSGPTALYLASSHQYEHIYILGFDFKGLDSGKKINNVYADTPNYKKSKDNATYYGNWLRQTCTVVKDNPKTQYTRVIQSDNYRPRELNNFKNCNTMYLEEFLEIFPHTLLSQNQPF